MPISKRNILVLLAGLALLISACSSTGNAPDALAFEDSSSDSSSSDSSTDDSSSDDSSTDDSSTETTAAPETTTAAPAPVRVDRPNETCSSSDYSVAFAENIWFATPNRPASYGPFTVNIPEGTYNVTLETWLGFEDLPSHTMEQWFFTTDSGYTSPLSTDFSPTLVGSDNFQAQIPAGTTSVSIFHKQQAGDVPNSVHPLCIGFDSVAPATTTTTAAPETTTAAPATTAAPETTAVAAPATTAAPETTTAAPETTAVAAPATTEAPDDDANALGANNQATTTTTAAPATTSTVADSLPSELALTGPGDLAFSLGLAGAALTLAGGAAVMAARRQEED